MGARARHPVKIPLKAEVAIRTPGGALGLGMADWADETRIQIRSELPIEQEEELELRLGVEGLPGKLSMKAIVKQKRMAGEMPVLVCLRTDMEPKALERFQHWMETVSDGGHIMDPASWMGRDSSATPSSDVDTFIEDRKGAGRESVQRALQQGLTTVAQQDEVDDPPTDLPSSEPERDSEKVGMELSGPVGHTFTVTFHDPTTLKSHLDTMLGGELQVPMQISMIGTLDLRLVLPDGQKLMLPAETRPGLDSTWLIFRLKRALKTKLKRAAGG